MTVPGTSVSRFSQATIPTHNGTLTVVVYRERGRRTEEREHVAIVAGPLAALGGADPVLARVHSECWTGETLGSLKCDCREQLDRALAAIDEAGRGLVVYLRQEGRGIGLDGKEFVAEGEGLYARAMQHEHDHLINKLLIDYVGPLKRQMIKRKMEKMTDEEADELQALGE